MPSPEGFEYSVLKDGEILITHHGKHAAVLRGRQAEKFARKLATSDPQHLMARMTGNHKRGNERE